MIPLFFSIFERYYFWETQPNPVAEEISGLPPRQNIIPISIEDEMRGAYIDYSMSVIVSRALPDVRDGLKPVHRRVLFGMQELGVNHNKLH